MLTYLHSNNFIQFGQFRTCTLGRQNNININTPLLVVLRYINLKIFGYFRQNLANLWIFFGLFFLLNCLNRQNVVGGTFRFLVLEISINQPPDCLPNFQWGFGILPRSSVIICCERFPFKGFIFLEYFLTKIYHFFLKEKEGSRRASHLFTQINKKKFIVLAHMTDIYYKNN